MYDHMPSFTLSFSDVCSLLPALPIDEEVEAKADFPFTTPQLFDIFVKTTVDNFDRQRARGEPLQISPMTIAYVRKALPYLIRNRVEQVIKRAGAEEEARQKQQADAGTVAQQPSPRRQAPPSSPRHGIREQIEQELADIKAWSVKKQAEWKRCRTSEEQKAWLAKNGEDKRMLHSRFVEIQEEYPGIAAEWLAVHGK